MKPMEFPRWQVDVTVNDEVVRSFHETATTSKAAVAKAKRKMRGAVSNAGAFKFTAKREGSAHATKTPTAEQLAALRTFANDNGRNWKSALNHAWSTGDWSHDYADNSGLLQQVRNQLGPRWLARFSFPKSHATKGRTTKKSKAQLDADIAASVHKTHRPGCGCSHATKLGSEWSDLAPTGIRVQTHSGTMPLEDATAVEIRQEMNRRLSGYRALAHVPYRRKDWALKVYELAQAKPWTMDQVPHDVWGLVLTDVGRK
jgi:hypothetical protein